MNIAGIKAVKLNVGLQSPNGPNWVPGLVKTGVEPKLIITESSVGVPQSGCVTLTFQVPD